MAFDPDLVRAFDILAKRAPAAWRELRLTYRRHDEAMDVITEMRLTDDRWAAFSYDRFDLMDLFEAYWDRTAGQDAAPWSILTIIGDRTGVIRVDYASGDPHIPDRTGSRD